MAVFGLVAGGCHNAWCWDRVRPELTARGHDAVAVTLPTSDPSAGLFEYAAAVASSLKGSTGELVLVGHSVAGRYLPLAARASGASRMIFLCALVPDEAAPDLSAIPSPSQPNAGLFNEEGLLYFTPERAAASFYHDCDEATTAWAVSELRPQGMKIARQSLPPGGWPAGTMSAYVLCRDDRTIVQKRAREMAARLGVEPVELPGSHSPFLSRPDVLAETFVRLLADSTHWSGHA
jgi:hypothetical protein